MYVLQLAGVVLEHKSNLQIILAFACSWLQLEFALAAELSTITYQLHS